MYREFLGNWLVLSILCFSGIGIPLAVIYVIENTITAEGPFESPSEFLDAQREKLKWLRWRR